MRVKKMTRTQFQSQFKRRVVFDEDTLTNVLCFDRIIFDTPVFRALERLVIVKDDGKYYIA